MHFEEKNGKTILVCTVGNTVLHYNARCIDDRHAMLRHSGSLGAVVEEPGG
jgi:hypothetical protein